MQVTNCSLNAHLPPPLLFFVQVIEAYNKLESYKVQKRSALKRDRDFAWKTLKERQKIRAELDAFDKKPP